MIDVVILFFIFGLVAGLLRSDLKLPPALYDSLSIFLMLAIGLKGGEGLAQQGLLPIVPQIFAVIVLGVVQTLIAFWFLRRFGRLNKADSAATAAHYGSVSVATFAVVIGWLTAQEIAFEPQMIVLLTVMEIPAIIVGILLAKGISQQTRWSSLAHEAFLGKGVSLLLGGVAIGWTAGSAGIEPIKPVFYELFKGVLALFLLEMGLIVSRQISALRQNAKVIVTFGIIMPLISACLGLACGLLLDLSVGGVTVLATLAASASYIAVPAAMRLAVPEANPAISLGASLGVTFPFNILFGIPLYYYMAQRMLGG